MPELIGTDAPGWQTRWTQNSEITACLAGRPVESVGSEGRRKSRKLEFPSWKTASGT